MDFPIRGMRAMAARIMINFAQMPPENHVARGIPAPLRTLCSKCVLHQSRGSLKEGAFDSIVRFAAIDAPSFRPFFRVHSTVKDTGESAAKAIIFGQPVGRSFGGGP
jgi:hypothetical protein